MLSWLYECVTGALGFESVAAPGPPMVAKPSSPSATVRAVRIPADGSAPHLVQLHTIDVRFECATGRVRCRIPDMRKYWGADEAWTQRDCTECTVNSHSIPSINGVYYGWKSYAVDHLPLSEHTGFYGDAFIVRRGTRERDQHGSMVYGDVPDGFITSFAYNPVLTCLRNG